MRNVIFGINITLDGCCDHTNQFVDEEPHEYWTGILREADLLVYGRKTYELMVPFWPEVAKNQSMTKALNEFAQVFDSINRVVFSRTLDSAEDKNTRIVRTDLRNEILRRSISLRRSVRTILVFLSSALSNVREKTTLLMESNT